MSTDVRLLYVTTQDLAQARSIALVLLDRRLIACANILPQMESIYRWQGKVETAQECVLILKTEARLVEDVTSAIEELHSYDVPCVLSLKIDAGSEDYLEWMKDQTRR